MSDPITGAVLAWIREVAPIGVKMALQPAHIVGLVDRLYAADVGAPVRAENERLREALRKIAEQRFSDADEPFDDALDIADAALAVGAQVRAQADLSKADA